MTKKDKRKIVRMILNQNLEKEQKPKKQQTKYQK